MTPAAFLAALDALGWSQRHLVRLLRCDTRLPGWWASGREPVPDGVAERLRTLVAAHARGNHGS